ncbi:MAG TPA: tRNA pseudouridine(55) synthase TruB [Candidatus Deferrimicrobium sp.]|nr:tRNA pseudouridine(55) synthase TruB [Candidatus Deferrimicrobium sp.]
MTSRDSRYNGILLFYKPCGRSSHDAVQDVRRAIRQRRVGHTGTLDPLAEGLLVLCLGNATKIAQFISGCDKTYGAEICLGQRSDTGDREGVVSPTGPSVEVNFSEEDLLRVLNQFIGTIEQRVPAYSAVQVGGERLYRLARRGIAVDPPERRVQIRELTLMDYHLPYVRIHVCCSSGTYIRSLADDIGTALGCGAYLSRLRRVAVGGFSVDAALRLDEIKRDHQADTLHSRLLPIAAALPYNAIVVDETFRDGIACGRPLRADHVVDIQGAFVAGDRIVLKDLEGHALAVGTAQVTSELFLSQKDDSLFTYIRVLN